MIGMKPLPETEPIENIVDMKSFVPDYMDFSFSLPRPRNPVQIHKARFGKQTKTIQGSAHRLWVWVRPEWTVFVGNVKGICFEGPKGATPDQAWAAWKSYKKAMAPCKCGGFFQQGAYVHAEACERTVNP
jgi:hypothetical protein